MPESKPSFVVAVYAPFGAEGIRMHNGAVSAIGLRRKITRLGSPEDSAARAVDKKCRLPDHEAYRVRRGHR